MWQFGSSAPEPAGAAGVDDAGVDDAGDDVFVAGVWPPQFEEAVPGAGEVPVMESPEEFPRFTR